MNNRFRLEVTLLGKGIPLKQPRKKKTGTRRSRLAKNNAFFNGGKSRFPRNLYRMR